MKKLVLLLLAAVVTIGLGSCENGKKDKSKDQQEERHERRW